MFTIKTNSKVYIDRDGREYIINPMTKERLYRYIPPLIYNAEETVLPNLPNLPIVESLLK